MRLLSLAITGSIVAHATATNYYFDGLALSNGTGTVLSPFNNLDVIPGLALQQGDRPLLKRGTSFTSSLAYGAGELPPSIQARPDQLNSIRLHGASNIVLQDIAVTNRGANTTARRGVYIYGEDAGAVSNILVQRMHIHTVEGYMPSTAEGDFRVDKYANPSGGIVLEATGNKTATYFQNFTVRNNLLDDVNRQGIYMWSNWCQRDALATFWFDFCFGKFVPSTGIRIRRNKLRNIGGDATKSASAGIWAANSDYGWFHHNVVSGGKTTEDGMSYDVDHSTSGTLFE
ncbi:hypothetical protein VHEMI08486 [[Torrubiella] hemipterigena]|uniref:Right handed beta helix domain-containing protein n=1 Tax=[Torrubiella] hemipterigena TaxID=1531966 RepID=A0A0A1TNK0_9HYPO|nr:hypothetical protein VHEMI08486 [[Torrubiella] hemipterigena]